jgi:hypothetical protein
MGAEKDKKVTCGPCGEVFPNWEAYLNHKCKAAGGHTPKEPEYLIKTTQPNFAKVSKTAMERGEKKKAK